MQLQLYISQITLNPTANITLLLPQQYSSSSKCCTATANFTLVSKRTNYFIVIEYKKGGGKGLG